MKKLSAPLFEACQVFHICIDQAHLYYTSPSNGRDNFVYAQKSSMNCHPLQL